MFKEMRGSRKFVLGLVTSLMLMGFVQTTDGATVYWTDWTSATVGNPGAASGTITSSAVPSIVVQYSGEVRLAQTTGGTNYWIPSTPYLSQRVSNAPASADLIALAGGNATVNTVTFSEPVENVLMGIVSLGDPNRSVRYQFNMPFEVVSSGKGFWGDGSLTALEGNILEGREGHGVIRFLKKVTTISWTVSTFEYWHGFTIGMEDPMVINPTPTTPVIPTEIPSEPTNPPSSVPEPTTGLLIGGGLLGIVVLLRKRCRL